MNKKILAILMALLMVLTSVAAFAEGNAFTITKQYDSDDATFVPGEELTFEANFDKFVAADAAADAPTSQPAYSGKITAVVGANTVTITGTGEFEAAGKYYYTLSEKAGSVQGVTYGEEKISFILTVGYEAGELTLLDVGVAKVDGEKNATITNEYNVGGVKISKTVTGNAANINDTFTATVTITAAGSNVLPEKFTVSYTDVEKTDESVELGTGTGNTSFEVTLKHGTDVVIENLPKGAIVTVAEKDSKVNGTGENDDTKYVASYTNNGAAAAAENVQTIAVTNTRTTTIDTGVNTDNMPYIMLMAFVMIIAAAVVLKKRTVNE